MWCKQTNKASQRPRADDASAFCNFLSDIFSVRRSDKTFVMYNSGVKTLKKHTYSFYSLYIPSPSVFPLIARVMLFGL